jgi:hypothetical protein
MLELFLFSSPCEVRVLGSDRLGVVVREQKRKLTATGGSLLEPRRECCVHSWTPCSRDVLVRHFARQRVLDHVFALTGNARAGAPANEVAILEHAQIGFRVQKLVHRSRPEDASDHRGRLKRGLLGGSEQIDPGRENRLNRVRHSEFARQLVQPPAALVSYEQTTINQHAEQLLDEEGIALGPLDNKLAEFRGQSASQQLVEHPDAVIRGERLQLEQLTADACTPTRSAFKKLRPRRRDQEQRPFRRAEHVLEQLEQLNLRPMNVLQKHNRGLLRDDIGQELGPGVLEAVARHEWMQITSDVEA